MRELAMYSVFIKPESDNYLVRVRAQVMTRDDSTGGWVPMGGGGLSIVGLRKILIPSEEDAKPEYLIYGQRTSDQSVVLNCVIRKDVQYNKVTPTFHHWLTEDKKFGLTFQSAADARAFDRGVKRAVEDLLDGSPDSSNANDIEIGDDEVFMTLDLPLERENSGSSSSSSSARPPSSTPSLSVEPYLSSYTHPHANHHHLHRMHFISRPPKSHGNGNGSNNSGSNGSSNNSNREQKSGTIEEIWVKHDDKKDQGLIDNDKIEIIQSDSYSYVQFAKDRPLTHEYSYPNLDIKSEKRDSISSLKKHNLEAIARQPPPLLPTKSKKKDKKKRDKHKHLLSERSRCRYCHEMFNHDENERGMCEYAPDQVRQCIDKASCMFCASCMLYHCMSDSEGDYAHPCSCDPSDETCCRRWVGLTILSLFVPCLWCYLPLRACHKCGVACGICGGRHKAS